MNESQLHSRTSISGCLSESSYSLASQVHSNGTTHVGVSCFSPLRPTVWLRSHTTVGPIPSITPELEVAGDVYTSFILLPLEACCRGPGLRMSVSTFPFPFIRMSLTKIKQRHLSRRLDYLCPDDCRSCLDRGSWTKKRLLDIGKPSFLDFYVTSILMYVLQDVG